MKILGPVVGTTLEAPPVCGVVDLNQVETLLDPKMHTTNGKRRSYLV
jgi:hypothetical protein